VADFRGQATVPSTHPCLPGHFPGRPVVPGVLLLEQVLEAAQRWRGPALRLTGLPMVKFLSPLQPDERCDIHLEEDGARIRFTCTAGGRVLAQGSLALAAEAP